MSKASRYDDRIARRSAPSLQVMQNEGARTAATEGERRDVALECGWGRLLFGQTFTEADTLVETLLGEREYQRDIALYLRDPHVVLSLAPQELFLDPSHTYRLWLATYRPGRIQPRGFVIRRLQHREDADAVNRILKQCGMLPADPQFMWEHRDSPALTHIVAEDEKNGRVIGTVTGVDHVEAFGDPENGSSLWCLGVDPQVSLPGVGRALVAYLADFFATRGRAYMDLSVMHDNEQAIALYESLGFVRIPAFCIKRKNPINEQLFVGPSPDEDLNPYARIIVDEARRRGISVDIIDAENGYFELGFGGRSIVCRESLSEMTTAIAMSRCDNKVVTRRLLAGAGLRVPAQVFARTPEANARFLLEHERVVVKPVSGEQGKGVAVGITDTDELDKAVAEARRYCDDVLIEEYVEGEDLRIIVIDFEVVAAAVRRPASVTGNGQTDIASLIEKQSRRRSAATGGESYIPLDAETERCVRNQGYSMNDTLAAGQVIRVRETANLHTGGTIHDVTSRLNPALRRVAERAARVLDIPVVGLDLLVPDVAGEDYVIIEANERPGLANHEPQPTAECFVDFLFPQTRRIR